MEILILYASRSGNTARAAEWIADILRGDNHSVTLHDAKAFTPQLLEKTQILLLGCSTIGEGDLLPAFFPWEKYLRDTSLSGKKGAAFGTGGQGYRHFAEAVDILENRLKNSGAVILTPGLKINTSLGLRREQVEPWAVKIAGFLKAIQP